MEIRRKCNFCYHRRELSRYYNNDDTSGGYFDVNNALKNIRETAPLGSFKVQSTIEKVSQYNVGAPLGSIVNLVGLFPEEERSTYILRVLDYFTEYLQVRSIEDLEYPLPFTQVEHAYQR